MAHDPLIPRGEAPFDFYPYNPNDAAGWTFVVLFAIGTAAHLTLVVLYRSWFFVPFVLGCLAEVGGYYGRAWAHDNIRLSDPYLLQLFLIIAAVPLLSASIYMSLSRITRALDADKHSLITLSWISKIYILIDIACLALQIAGTVIQAYGGEGEQQTAVNCVAGGLIFQLVAYVVFALLAFKIHRGLVKEPSQVSEYSRIRWRAYFWCLYISSALVLVRNLVRVLEFLQGSDGVIMRHEAFLYIFDAAPMFVLVVLVAVLHPGRLIKAARRLSKVGANRTPLAVPWV